MISDPAALQAKGLSPLDVVNAIGVQNLILPAGTAKIGNFEHDVDINASPKTVEELNDLPIRVVGRSPILIRDVAHVRNGYPPQTNIVRVDGRRSSMMAVQKSGNASTLDIIARVKEALARAMPGLPPELTVRQLADQSLFVRASIDGVVREAVIAACLTALLILILLGSWRSTVIIAISIPLSMLASIIGLGAIGQTINIMTLGGLALAIGILVDHAIVAIENISVHLEHGKDLEPAILDGAQQITIPAFVSTLCICIVFVPMFFLTGVARYLFVPMAEAVVFAMLASWALSRTLVPTMAKYMLKAHEPDRHATRRASRNPLVRGQAIVDAGFRRLRDAATGGCSRRASSGAACSPPCSSRSAWSRFGLLPWVGQDFFPAVDSGQFKLHLRGAHRHAHRGDRHPVRPRRRRHARAHPEQRDGERHRQHRDAVQRSEPGLHELDAHRPVRRGHPRNRCGRITARPPSTSGGCASSCRSAFPACCSRSCRRTSCRRR